MLHLIMAVTDRVLGDQLSKLIQARSSSGNRLGALSMMLHGVQPHSRMHANYLMRTAYGQPHVEETPDAVSEITSLWQSIQNRRK